MMNGAKLTEETGAVNSKVKFEDGRDEKLRGLVGKRQHADAHRHNPRPKGNGGRGQVRRQLRCLALLLSLRTVEGGHGATISRHPVTRKDGPRA